MPQTLTGGKQFNVEVQGLNTVLNHILGFAYLWDSFAYQIVDVTADIGVEEARRLINAQGLVITGRLLNSIEKDPSVRSGASGFWTTRYGTDVPYAPYVEFGTQSPQGNVHSPPYPFIVPSADLAERPFVGSIISFLDLLCGGEGVSSATANNPAMRSHFSSIRSFLYTGAKALGDVSLLGGRGIFGPVRSMMYSLARTLGDVASTMNGTIGQRVSNRLTGRATGRLIGFGSASLSHSRSYSGFVGGAGGHRLYQRVAGHFGVSTRVSFTNISIPGL